MPCHWFLSNKSYKRKIKKGSLQAVKNPNKKTFPPTDVLNKIFGRVSPCIFSKKNKQSRGSLTVEAALLLPLFFLGMTALICVMDIYRIQSQVNVSLNESAKELGMYAYAARNHPDESPVGIVSDGVCIAYAKAKLDKEEGVTVNLTRSRYQNQRVELVADISYRIPAAPIPLPEIKFQSWARVHDWTGYTAGQNNQGQSNDELVYITDRQTVYHTFSGCSHLNLSIIQTTPEQAGKMRNKNGAKYYACPHCVNSDGTNQICYITEQGNRYHESRSCQSLSRSVRLVPKSETNGIGECSRCAQRGGNHAD